MRFYFKILLVFILLLLFLSSFFKYYHKKEKSITTISGIISEGDTLLNLLIENNIPQEQSYEIVNALKKILNMKRCNIGDKWEIIFAGENFLKFTYQNGPFDYYTVSYNPETNTYISEKHRLETEIQLLGAKGKINSSLYESMVSLGISPEIIIQFAEIFSSKIDFFTDCQKGDEFSLLWNSYIHNGELVKDIRVIAANYKNNKDSYFGFYFEIPNGEGRYYDKKGNSVESAFLKAPLNYRRISSYFSYRRFHPILKIYRPHLGIDYAAPRGTPVSTIGNGKVIFAGWKGGFGKMVQIKHPNGFISYYGHLSKIAKGIKIGKRVNKGQVIGYVGATGLATGPHLDFRVKNNNKFINFLKLKFPPSYPLPKKYMPEFEKEKLEMLKKLMELEENKITTFEEENVSTKKNNKKIPII